MPRDLSGWKGIFPAAMTMFDSQGGLDEAATASHVEWLFDQGSDGVVLAGTTGEFVGLDEAERRALIDLAVSVGAGRGPIIVGTGTYSTKESVALTEYALEAGACGALVVQPYFQRPNRDEIMDHFRAVGSVGLPIMVYNIPANSAAAAVSPRDLAILHDEGKAQAVKSTAPAPGLINDIRCATDDSFRVFYGGVAAPLEGAASGAHAWVSGLLNIMVPRAVDLWTALDAGDQHAAGGIWREMRALRDLILRWYATGVGDIALYRAVLEIQGRPAGHSRLPLQPLMQAEKSRLHSEIDALEEHQDAE